MIAFKTYIVVFQIMTDTHKVPTIKISCHAQNRLQDLELLSLGLEKCQKSLNDYLDSKRNAFPRFFFISDDELLSILGSSDPECVQEHMIKVCWLFQTQINLDKWNGTEIFGVILHEFLPSPFWKPNIPWTH